MFYPPEFIIELKVAFPDEEELHKSLDEGNPDVIRRLNKICPYNAVPPEFILAAKDFEEVKELARLILKTQPFTNWWYRIRDTFPD